MTTNLTSRHNFTPPPFAAKVLTAMVAALSITMMLAGCSSEPTAPKAADAAAAAPVAPTPKEYSGPVTLKILSPRDGEVVSTTDVPVKFDLQNYDVQPNGQHIHVILDNEAYQPDYNVAEPFILKAVKPGIHTIRAFPARAWHESIKDPGAFAAVTFYVENKTGKAPVNFGRDPLLTYSRPKGKYEGEKANRILFDFWIKNANLAPDEYKVKYQLDDQPTQTLDQWKPSFFENLPVGKHKLMVELLDKKGRLVKGKYNKTEREFEVAK